MNKPRKKNSNIGSLERWVNEVHQDETEAVSRPFKSDRNGNYKIYIDLGEQHRFQIFKKLAVKFYYLFL